MVRPRQAQKRVTKAMPPVAVAPALISDRTCFALVGLSHRQFRDLLREHPEIPRHVIGRRVLVAATDLVDFVRAVRPADMNATPSNDTDDDADQLESVDAVLAAVGRRRI